MQKEIFKTKLFDRLYEERPDIVDVIREKVVPVSGDLCIEKLGMDPEIRQQLIDEVDIIMNVAASIDFDEPIHDALQVNYFGASRVLELAHESKKV